MTVQQWRKVDPIFKSSARLAGSERTAHLERRCRGNEEIRQEVEILLANYDRSSAFLGVLSSGGVQTVSHYKVLERIGEGGMGHVFKALDTRLNRMVALKALPPWAASNQAARDLLLEEARCACRLNHPNIVTIYEILKQENADYIVMEYLPGRTLKDRIPAKGLPFEDAVRYALSIAGALTHAHAAGILHRDLKPSNIFITDQDRVKLLDFGLAVPLTDTDGKQTSKPSQAWGTSVYMAPEQFRSGPPDPRSDLFSFGLILWEMLTGKHPFGTGSPAEIAEAIRLKPFPERPSRKVSAPLVQVVSRCLEKEPLSRYQFIHEVHNALTTIDADARGLSAQPPTLDSGHVSPLSPLRSADFRKARAAIAQMNGESLVQCREADRILRALLEQNDSEALQAMVRSAMRDLLLSVPKFKSASVSSPVREIRKLALELHKFSSQGNMHRYFRPTDFEYLDLFEMNFSTEALVGFHFDQAFLTCSTFERCDLSNSSFDHCRIRNVNFSGANLSGATFSSADWFNALNLTASQVTTIQPETLMECPSNQAGLRAYLDNHYVFPFASWEQADQRQLLSAWDAYLCPGGLRDFVCHLRQSLR